MARKKKLKSEAPVSQQANPRTSRSEVQGRAEDIKRYKIIYSVPGVNAQLSFDTTDTDEKNVRERFKKLFNGLTIINVEEVTWQK